MSLTKLPDDILSVLFEYLSYQDLSSFVNLRKKYASLVKIISRGDCLDYHYLREVQSLFRFNNLHTIKPTVLPDNLTDMLILSRHPSLRHLKAMMDNDYPSTDFLDISKDPKENYGERTYEFAGLYGDNFIVLEFLENFFCNPRKRSNVSVTAASVAIDVEVDISKSGYITVSLNTSDNPAQFAFISVLLSKLLKKLNISKIDEVIIDGYFFHNKPLYTDNITLKYWDEILNVDRGSGYPNLLDVHKDDYKYKKITIDTTYFDSDVYYSFWDYASQNTLAYNESTGKEDRDRRQKKDTVLEYLDLPFSDEIDLPRLLGRFPNLKTIGIYSKDTDRFKNIINSYLSKHFIIYVDHENCDIYNKIGLNFDNLKLHVI